MGEAVRRSGLPRSDIFVVTKLAVSEHGRDKTRAALAASLERLGLGYVDLYLIHTALGGQLLETWDTMLELRDAGKCRAVGVSNFGVPHLAGLAAAGRELPDVNQVELSCWLQQRPLAEFCASHGIRMMAYSPLAKTWRLEKTRVAELAARAGCSEAQLAIRWSLEQGFITIPSTPGLPAISASLDFLGVSRNFLPRGVGGVLVGMAEV